MKKLHGLCGICLLAMVLAGCTPTSTSSAKPSTSASSTTTTSSSAKPTTSSSKAPVTSSSTAAEEDSFVEPTVPSDYDYYLYYDVNYTGGTNPDTQFIKKSRKVAEADIPIPEREGYLFNGWYTSKESAAENDALKAFSFRTAIRNNYHFYAGWIDCSGEHTSQEYVFEAEYARGIQDMSGMGYSGEAKGKGLISSDDESKSYQASNGYFVTYLYVNGLSLDFTVYSDQAVTGVKFVWRLSAEFRDADLTPSNYDIKVNGEALNFQEAKVTYNPSGVKPFADFTVKENLSLKKGANTFSFAAANEIGGMGTMGAIAPMIDCFKLTTTAKLNWLPESSNI